ncbi:ornithine cyclodeaminase family protein [Aquabacter spiritensis]|uniref:Ornithine cyclodeaminase/alanine dehydrogenase n=1 Tax=Aquabacter spiritensis TaxID=933073 RepID=A0A4R3M0J8_9HYPH|nr:ornithine cyclodeaminase family protein [Aquabacter spiritensis]TCT06106.1 ornithine cyclodeaminase/alanine dehydrogenase [Aquabacter spiritensis]
MTPNAPLFLSEADVGDLVDVADAIDALDGCFGASPDETYIVPRQRAPLPGGMFHLMAATYAAGDVFGLKAYSGAPQGTFYHVMLYSYSERRLLALIEANLLSQLRTGAASGLATRQMARADADVLAVIGTGKQAFWQAAAIAAVRDLKEIRVFGRDRERREAFAGSVESRLAISTRSAPDAETCVRGASIVATITKAHSPVCLSAWVDDGAHVNVAGANAADRREVDGALIERAALLVTDDIPQAHMEAAEFRDLAATGAFDWARVRTLSDVTRSPPARRAADVTLFKSLGVAIEDVALAKLVYARAVAEGRGVPIDRNP